MKFLYMLIVMNIGLGVYILIDNSKLFDTKISEPLVKDNAEPSIAYKKEVVDSKKQRQGVVKWFHSEKGFGFIKLENSPDIFVHFRSVLGGNLSEGDKVIFQIEEGQKGLQAFNVRIVNEVSSEDNLSNVPVTVR